MALEQKQVIPLPYEQNLTVLNETERETAKLLLELDQGHLFLGWPAPGTQDAEKKQMLAQAAYLNSQYRLQKYVENAKKLLADSKAGVNPYEGWKPSVPHGVRLDSSSSQFHELEKLGMDQVRGACFVLVAGGLGERLGYNGIKLALPAEITTEHCFLQLYVNNILALQTRARMMVQDDSITLPLVIMTSDDTHSKTLQLLEAHQHFGMPKEQLTILKQEKVPALLDNDAHFALSNPFEISTKPHGHGDVHMLLFQAGLVKKWRDEGRKWVIFFQDTNGLVFRAVPAALGVSAHHKFEVNSLTVPRMPGEAVGGICTLTHSDGRAMTVNVEYNQLDPLLRATVDPKGDVPDDSGFSPYPGNINVLVFAVEPYAANLERTEGHIPEFVNPKYADSTKTKFTSATRLESMMQDYPKLLDPSARVGFTQCERWLCFSAVKNNVADAAAKFAKTGAAESASSGEADMYYYNRRILASHKECKVELDVEGKQENFCNIPTKLGARVVLEPSWGTTVTEIHSKIHSQGHINISPRSTLIIDGKGIAIGNLELDGTLIIRSVLGAHVTIKNLKVHNDGWSFKPIDPNDKQYDEKYRIRGYVLEKKAERVLVFDKPGKYEVDEK